MKRMIQLIFVMVFMPILQAQEVGHYYFNHELSLSQVLKHAFACNKIRWKECYSEINLEDSNVTVDTGKLGESILSLHKFYENLFKNKSFSGLKVDYDLPQAATYYTMALLGNPHCFPRENLSAEQIDDYIFHLRNYGYISLLRCYIPLWLPKTISLSFVNTSHLYKLDHDSFFKSIDGKSVELFDNHSLLNNKSLSLSKLSRGLWNDIKDLSTMNKVEFKKLLSNHFSTIAQHVKKKETLIFSPLLNFYEKLTHQENVSHGSLNHLVDNLWEEWGNQAEYSIASSDSEHNDAQISISPIPHPIEFISIFADNV